MWRVRTYRRAENRRLAAKSYAIALIAATVAWYTVLAVLGVLLRPKITLPPGIRHLDVFRVWDYNPPYRIAVDANGNAFFFAAGNTGVGGVSGIAAGTMSPQGKLDSFMIPTRGQLNAIAYDQHGTLWASAIPNVEEAFTSPGDLVKIENRRLHVQLRTPRRYGGPDQLVAAPDGRLWFTLSDAPALGHFDPKSRAFATVDLQNRLKASALALATDGTFYASSETGAVLQIRARRTSVLPVVQGEVVALTPGANADIWFLERKPASLGHILRNGSIVARPLEHAGQTGPIAFDRGRVWVADESSGLWRIEAATGRVTYVPLPDRRSHVNDIAFAPDGTVWIAETIGDQRCFADCGAVARIIP